MDVGAVGERMRKDRRGAEERNLEAGERQRGLGWSSLKVAAGGSLAGNPPGIRAEATAGPVTLTVTTLPG